MANYNPDDYVFSPISAESAFDITNFNNTFSQIQNELNGIKTQLKNINTETVLGSFSFDAIDTPYTTTMRTQYYKVYAVCLWATKNNQNYAGSLIIRPTSSWNYGFRIPLYATGEGDPLIIGLQFLSNGVSFINRYAEQNGISFQYFIRKSEI